MKKILPVLFVIVYLLLIYSMDVAYAQTGQEVETDPSTLANCLSEKKFVMYGRAGCSACELEKQYFGQAFSLINYLDCDASSENRNLCDSKNIKAYPTWEDEQGKQYRGAISLPILAQIAQCQTITPTLINQQNTGTNYGETYYGENKIVPEKTAHQSLLIILLREYGGILLAGLLSFFAPCLIPLLPTYLSIISGYTFAELYGLEFSKIRGRVFKSALFFVLGFTLIFTLLGATGSIIGSIINNFLPQLLFFSGFLLIILGLMQLQIIKIPAWEFDYAWVAQRRNAKLGLVSALATGVVSALCWIPCIGPVLASILLLAADSQSVLKGMSYLLVYAAGVMSPFLLAALFFPKFFDTYREKRKYLKLFSIASGFIIIAFGLLLIFNKYGDFISFYYSIVNLVPVKL